MLSCRSAAPEIMPRKMDFLFRFSLGAQAPPQGTESDTGGRSGSDHPTGSIFPPERLFTLSPSHPLVPLTPSSSAAYHNSFSYYIPPSHSPLFFFFFTSYSSALGSKALLLLIGTLH